MAQKTFITLIDDVDGSKATETVSFGLDKNTYEIDLNETNAAELRAALRPHIDHGRRSSGRRTRRTTT